MQATVCVFNHVQCSLSARHLRSLSPTSSCRVHLDNFRLYFAIAQGVDDRSVKLKGIRIHVYTLNHYQIPSLAEVCILVE